MEKGGTPMLFEYTGRHIDVTPALKKHTEEHFSRIDHLFNGKAAKAHVILEVERGKHRAEMIVNWWNDVLTATTVQDDMYQSISQTIDKIEKQALKLKKKVIDKSHKATKASTIVQQEAEIAPAPDGPAIVPVKGYDIMPMTPEEAALQLSGDSQNFLVFRNSDDSERVSVLFRRDDGNYGLIET
jgi:putative sigma-54 modulation protein